LSKLQNILLRKKVQPTYKKKDICD